MGTKGELTASMDSAEITVYDFATKQHETVLVKDLVADESIIGGHGGGDGGIISSFCRLVGNNESSVSVCSAMVSARNHIAVFAAEQARHTSTVVDVACYEQSL